MRTRLDELEERCNRAYDFASQCEDGVVLMFRLDDRPFMVGAERCPNNPEEIHVWWSITEGERPERVRWEGRRDLVAHADEIRTRRLASA